MGAEVAAFFGSSCQALRKRRGKTVVSKGGPHRQRFDWLCTERESEMESIQRRERRGIERYDDRKKKGGREKRREMVRVDYERVGRYQRDSAFSLSLVQKSFEMIISYSVCLS